MDKGGLGRDQTHSNICCALLMELQKIVIEQSLVLHVSAITITILIALAITILY